MERREREALEAKVASNPEMVRLCAEHEAKLGKVHEAYEVEKRILTLEHRLWAEAKDRILGGSEGRASVMTY